MVKKRAPARKRGSARRGSTRKRRTPSTQVELSRVRKEVQRVVRQIETGPAPNDRVRKVLEDMRMTLAAIDDNCGPVMTVPFA
jgi:hypothetical protein